MSVVSPSFGANGPVSLDRLASQSGAHKTKPPTSQIKTVVGIAKKKNAVYKQTLYLIV